MKHFHSRPISTKTAAKLAHLTKEEAINDMAASISTGAAPLMATKVWFWELATGEKWPVAFGRYDCEHCPFRHKEGASK